MVCSLAMLSLMFLQLSLQNHVDINIIPYATVESLNIVSDSRRGRTANDFDSRMPNFQVPP